jgi:hypothetical protein
MKASWAVTPNAEQERNMNSDIFFSKARKVVLARAKRTYNGRKQYI